MNAFIPEDSQLPVLQGHIEQYTIAGCGLLHFQPCEDLCGPVERVDIAATAFDVYADLAAGALFRLANG